MNGILVLDKPAGVTSFQAVRAVSRYFNKEKAGHAGTLDPMATGVLPVFLGRATKLISLLPQTDKEYVANLRFGAQTDTGDREGEIIGKTNVLPSESAWNKALEGFLGQQEQIPPMYSAVSQNGVRLYQLAREGKTVERKPRSIYIRELQTLQFSPEEAQIRVVCSAGTYVRTLAEDLAKACGSLAYLTELRRTAACGFSVQESVTLAQLEQAESPEDHCIDGELPFRTCPLIQITEKERKQFLNGVRFSMPAAADERTGSGLFRIYHNEQWLGLGREVNGQLVKEWQAFI